MKPVYRSDVIKMDNVAVICGSLTETIHLQRWLDDIGWKSCDGNPFNESWLTAVHKEEKGCDLKRGKRGSRKFYDDKNYIIVNFWSLSEDIGFEF